MKLVPLSSIIKTYFSSKVSAGETAELVNVKIPKPYVGFIYKIANSWYPNTFLKFIIDGELVEILKMRRDITNPLEYEPPIVVKHSIKVIVVNNSSEDHYFEFWVDGVGAEEEARVL